MEIYLIRHGETTGDIENRFGGSYDDHLTARGREQLESTAKELKGKGIEIIFSSPLIRARESSEIIANQIIAPVEYIDGLKERDYGILTGLIKTEAEAKYPEVVKLHENYKNTDPGGESYEHFCKRVIEAFTSISTKNYGTVAILTHGGPIKTIYRYLGKGELPKLNDGHILKLQV